MNISKRALEDLENAVCQKCRTPFRLAVFLALMETFGAKCSPPCDHDFVHVSELREYESEKLSEDPR